MSSTKPAAVCPKSDKFDTIPTDSERLLRFAPLVGRRLPPVSPAEKPPNPTPSPRNMLVGRVAPIQPPHVKHGNEVVSIVVGNQQQEFTIHKNPICAASAFFQTALTSNFIEGAAQKVTLPEEDPQFSQLVYNWLYSGRVADGVTTYLRKEDVCSGDIFWWKVYQMGDRLMMDRLRVLAIAKIQNFFTERKAFVPSKQFIEELFDFAKLPLLETYMVQHVVFWLHKSADATVWGELADAHMRFGQALAKQSIMALNSEDVHPHEGNAAHGLFCSLSPWETVGISVPPEEHNRGGNEVRAKHMREYTLACNTRWASTHTNAERAEVIDPEDDGVSEDVDEKQVTVGQAPEYRMLS
ncbi:hypothetical protein A1O7_07677 [Cladophialophora yegresii CBS 114405]|uniref:BTB domain-containing protein n=1 Tax=Cladophialophora yegresii CBS 114405 TaxID=1182544 RepID=W9VXB4_9EURO|nr:uncharacterized protein A1O7_07677 [Cladophialophora yegresii CBS 114405]EXJ57330.1 hypothetical protein A1O7_07677 [Cladophialophora yegresii CBS 114405]